MGTVSIGFNLSASAVQMAAGINAGVVELQKLGYAAKRTAADVATLKTIELSRAFISSVRAAGTALLNFVDGPAQAATALVDLSKRTGVSASALQSYQFAAEASGVSVEAFAKAMQTLTITLAKAQNGEKEASQAFANLGIAAGDLAGLSAAQQFEKIADAIAQLPTPAAQATASIDLFGKTGRNLLSVFQEGPGYLARMADEAKKVGIVLSNDQLGALKEVEASLGTLGKAFAAFSARVSAELAPAIKQASDQVISFLATLDQDTINRFANAAGQSLSQLASALQLVAVAAEPLARNTLATIGAYLAFINRQAISAGIKGLASAFVSAGTAAFAYATGATTAAAATATLAVAVRGFLASTGVGLLVVLLGAAGGAALEWALNSRQAGAEVAASVEDPKRAIDEYNRRARQAIANTEEFGLKAKEALKVPGFTAQDLAQEAIDEASSAVKSLAKELGGLNMVPAELLDKFRSLKGFAESLTTDSLAYEQNLQIANARAQSLTQEVRAVTEARKRDTDEVRKSAEAAQKAAQEARSRTAELAVAGLSDAEKSRLQLNRDLLAIGQEQRAAEEALAEAKRASDAKGIADARERLRLAQEAVKAAKEQDRERQLQALGINESLLRPATTLADQFKAVREAFDRRLIDGGEARQALRNLATEGIEIRRQIARELSRPAEAALEVSDVRTSEGMSRFMSLAAGRQDPAIEQMRQQLGKLEEIRRELQRVGANPVDILGG